MYPQELVNCQRYYQQSFPIGTAPAQNISTCFYTFSTTVSNFVTGCTFQVPMRGTPNILTYNPYAANNSFRVPNSVTDVAVTPIASAVGIMYFTCTLAAPSGLHGNFTATAEL